MRRTYELMLLVFAASLALSTTAAKAQAVVDKSAFAPLLEAPPLRPTTLGVDGLAKLFPEFKHVPFESSGFRSIALPFLYSDPDHAGDPNEANAMTFLLSDALDFAAGNYGTRHAYFVFKRDRDNMQALAQNYDPAVITRVMANWKATHAIGGTLVRAKDGFGGALEVYDPAGKIVHQAKFEKPRTFFLLLGDMAGDLLNFFGPKPDDSLLRFLHTPSCKESQSLIDLGSTAFMAERSDEEFATYKRILARDPDFAQVRFWSANQKFWMNQNAATYALETALSLKSRPSINALTSFVPADCPDKELAGHYGEWAQAVAQMLGPDHPFSLEQHMGNCRSRDEYLATRKRATEVAGQFPNDRNLLLELGKAYQKAMVDLGMFVSISTASLQNRYLTGTGEKTYERQRIESSLVQLGRYDIVMELIEWPGEKDGYDVEHLMHAATFGGQYQLAANVFRGSKKLLTPDAASNIAPNAAFAAALCGRLETFERIVDDEKPSLAASGLTDTFNMLGQLSKGQFSDPPPNNSYFIKTEGYEARWNVAAWVCNDLAQKKQRCRDYAAFHLYWDPLDRLGWICFDAYEKQTPSAQGPAFYEFLGWMYPDDPWVKEAVAAYSVRSQNKRADEDVDALTKDLRGAIYDVDNGLKPTVPSFKVSTYRVAAALHQLVVANQYDKAIKLAELNLDFHNDRQAEWDQMYAAFALYHKVEQSKAAAGL